MHILSIHDDNSGRRATAGDQRFIGKFGVGAKQGGFFLGDSIKIFTKEDTTSQILELTLDVRKFNEKYGNGENPYEEDVRRHSTLDTITDLSGSSQTKFSNMESNIRKHISRNNHFTIVIIELNHETITRLLTRNRYETFFCQIFQFLTFSSIFVRYLDLKTELADIYHFHLHPENKPSVLASHSKFQPKSTGK